MRTTIPLLSILLAIAPFQAKTADGTEPAAPAIPDKAADLIVKGEFVEALKKLPPPSQNSDAAKLAASIKKIVDIDSLVGKRLKSMVGQKISVPTSSGARSGTIKDVKNGVLQIQIEKKGARLTVPVKLKSIPLAYKIEQAKLDDVTKNIALGVICFSHGAYVTAEGVLKQTGPFAAPLIDACERATGYFREMLSACRENDKQAVAELMKKGGDPNATCLMTVPNKRKKIQETILTTLLIETIKSGNMEMAKFLIESGANPNKTNSKKGSPLMYAIFHCPDGNPFITYLLEHKANPNAKDKTGNTPMAGALAMGKSATALLLLDHGADPNQPATKGVTPIMLAVMSNNVKLVKALLAKGADIRAKTPRGWGALQLDRSKLSPELQAILSKYAPPKKKTSPMKVFTH